MHDSQKAITTANANLKVIKQEQNITLEFSIPVLLCRLGVGLARK